MFYACKRAVINSALRRGRALYCNFPANAVSVLEIRRTHTHTHTHTLSLCLSVSFTLVRVGDTNNRIFHSFQPRSHSPEVRIAIYILLMTVLFAFCQQRRARRSGRCANYKIWDVRDARRNRDRPFDRGGEKNRRASLITNAANAFAFQF